MKRLRHGQGNSRVTTRTLTGWIAAGRPGVAQTLPPPQRPRHGAEDGGLRVDPRRPYRRPLRADYTRQARRLQCYAKRHYTFGEIERLPNAPRTDNVLTCEAPKGFQLERHRQGRNFVGPA